VESGKWLSEYSTACQELLILDDLLYAMMGVEGRYLYARRSTGSGSGGGGGGGGGGAADLRRSTDRSPKNG